MKWEVNNGEEITRPQSNVMLSVSRWSKLWVWMIQKDGKNVARGIADEASEARTYAEAAWDRIKDTDSLIQINSPFERRSRGWYWHQ